MVNNMRRKKQNRIFIITALSLFLLITVGYAAFSTNLSLKAKGNIKDINEETDKKVPKDQLLFWGQANNKENTLTTLKDKSGNNNDGTLYNFNNTSQSGFNNGELILDGVDDYVDIGLANYNFKNSISYVIYIKINELNRHQIFFGNWGVNKPLGGGLYLNATNDLIFDMCNGTLYNGNISDTTMTSNNYYTFVTTYDGKESKLFINGALENTKEVSEGIPTSPNSVLIGSYVVDGTRKSFANISVKEAMIYDRALSEEEVNIITQGFQKKYKNS